MYRAEELDPLSLMMKSNVAGVLYYAHQWDAAIDKCQEILRVDPSFGMAHRRLMQRLHPAADLQVHLEDLPPGP